METLMHRSTLLMILLLLFRESSGSDFTCSQTYQPVPAGFKSARPVWIEGKEREMNLFAGFRTVFHSTQNAPCKLRITASSVYRVFLNGEFSGYGPARGPHGFYRVDEWDLDPGMKGGANILAIEVAGYNVNSYYLLDQPAFLQAEIESGDSILAFTEKNARTFEPFRLDERLQKVQRYSFQRPFIEVYRLSPEHQSWKKNLSSERTPVTLTETAPKQTLQRGVPYPLFQKRQPIRIVSKGTVEKIMKNQGLWKDRSLTRIGPFLKGFPEKELERIPSIELQQYRSLLVDTAPIPFQTYSAFHVRGKTFTVLDLGKNLTGFIGMKVKCPSPVHLALTFDEILMEGDVDFRRLGCVNTVVYELAPGEYDLESFEPYTMRYLKIISMSGDAEISACRIREYANPDIYEAAFASSDPDLNLMFDAARETYRQNAVDLFMDCPSRERAGWLCDSYFTSRTAFDLSGDTKVETNFFENYLLPRNFPDIPEGMLPMCYPADHPKGDFIPNWSLWFVLELEEFGKRGGDPGMISAFEPKIMALFDYFHKFENKDGLLEKLESWVFVEWSRANDFVQDVNYPTNMLYKAALESAGRLYGRDSLVHKAARIGETVLKRSFDGSFFVDNSLRKGNRLELTGNRTEVCQYFAFYFGIASPLTHPELWSRVVEKFGPGREREDSYPDVHKANAFIGNFLRMELLSRYGFTRQLIREAKDFFLGMARRTGTFWENMNDRASLNHGFASHVAHMLYRDALGVTADPVRKTVSVRPGDTDLSWCEGRLPVEHGFLFFRWVKDSGRINLYYEIPAGYTLDVINKSEMPVVTFSP